MTIVPPGLSKETPVPRGGKPGGSASVLAGLNEAQPLISLIRDAEGEGPQRAVTRRGASFIFDPNRVLSPRVPPFRRLRPVPGSIETGNGQRDRSDALMCRVAEGDSQAFAALYDELANVMHAIILRVVRDPAHAEEVAQEALLDLWRRARNYDPKLGSVRAWAVSLAHRRAVDRVRSEQASRNRDDRVARLQVVEVDDASVEVEDNLERERVKRALDVLTPLERQTLELAYYEGHTYREVGVLLGVSESTVKSRMRDGLRRLRDVMWTAP